MIGRDKQAADHYRQASRKKQHELIMYSQCDTGRGVGLARGYMAKDLTYLARIRLQKASTRSTKIKRKADFYFTLARMAERSERLSTLTIDTQLLS